LHGKNIVLDTASGSIHVVDDVAFLAIKTWQSYVDRQSRKMALREAFASDTSLTDQEIDALFAAIESLIKSKKLFAPEMVGNLSYEELAARHSEKRREIKALCLHVSHTCNLTCDYCFAQAGRYHGKEALMPLEVGKRALDFLIAQSGKRRHLEVDFFGGEPLMNWDVVKELVRYARAKESESGKQFRFTLTTNGLLLDDNVIAFCNDEMSNVVLSLDGRRAIHDKLRRTVNGRGSYDVIVPKFQDFVRMRGGKNYYMRGTFTHENPDFLADILHMADLGFYALSMEPVVCDAESPHALTRADIETVKEQYEQLALEMKKRAGQPNAFTFYHYQLDLKHGPCLYKRLTGCGSGTEYLAVTPMGELYPCHQFVGDPRFRMGDVWKGVSNNALREDFRGCSLFKRQECRDCWAKLFCAGGCAANHYHASGSIHGLYADGCELFKKRVECALWLHSVKGL
jgi:uncharacterized protein